MQVSLLPASARCSGRHTGFTCTCCGAPPVQNRAARLVLRGAHVKARNGAGLTAAGDKLFFDKRDGSNLDLLTVAETAPEPVLEDKDNINGVQHLSIEATATNQALLPAGALAGELGRNWRCSLLRMGHLGLRFCRSRQIVSNFRTFGAEHPMWPSCSAGCLQAPAGSSAVAGGVRRQFPAPSLHPLPGAVPLAALCRCLSAAARSSSAGPPTPSSTRSPTRSWPPQPYRCGPPGSTLDTLDWTCASPAPQPAASAWQSWSCCYAVRQTCWNVGPQYSALLVGRYRKFKVSEDVQLVVRCEIDGVMTHKGQDEYLSIKALNEYDPKVTGKPLSSKQRPLPLHSMHGRVAKALPVYGSACAGEAEVPAPLPAESAPSPAGVDWRQKLDTQRGRSAGHGVEKQCQQAGTVDSCGPHLGHGAHQAGLHQQAPRS